MNWRDRIVPEELPAEPQSIADFNGVSVVIPGNLTILRGVKKSRKSLCAAYVMAKIAGKVIVIDTEQSIRHTYYLRDRIRSRKIDGHHVVTLYARGLSHTSKRQLIKDVVNDNPDAKAILIDNLRDLQRDINSSSESFETIELIESLLNDNEIAVIGVIHSNKGNGQIRGHIGSELENRAYMTIELKNKRGYSEVSCESSRDGDFTSFNLRHNPENGLPEIVMNFSTSEIPQSIVNQLPDLLCDNSFKYGELKSRLIDNIRLNESELTERKAKELIGLLTENDYLIQTGVPRTPSVRYQWNPNRDEPVQVETILE